jgi:hypothetical protein
MRIKLSAAVVFALCSAAAAAQTAAPATSSTLPLRAALQAISPTSMSALEHIEARRGKQLTDPEILEAVKSPEFAREYELALNRFCADPGHANVLACADRSRPAAN